MTQGKWSTVDSYDGERTLKQHYYIPAMRGKFYEESYLGNRSACKISGGVGDENERYIPVADIEEEQQSPNCCKKCLKWYNSQPK